MATIVLPFSREEEEETENKNSLFQKLPQALQEVTESNPHLLEYLMMLPISQIGIPEYYPKPSNKLGDLKEPNLIYPVGNGIFTHILVDFKDSRNNYIQIEPSLTMNIDELVATVERTCIDFADRLPMSPHYRQKTR